MNLSVQNNLETHQYVRKVIEIQKDQNEYHLRLDEFETPASWYEENDISQVDIPEPDLSKVEALSFESCQLIKANDPDGFRITKMILTKNDSMNLTTMAACVVLLIILNYYLFKERD